MMLHVSERKQFTDVTEVWLNQANNAKLNTLFTAEIVMTGILKYFNVF
jgi:hypothetical protein